MSWRLLSHLVLGLPYEVLWGQNGRQYKWLSRLMVPIPKQVASCWEGHGVQTFTGRKNGDN